MALKSGYKKKKNQMEKKKRTLQIEKLTNRQRFKNEEKFYVSIYYTLNVALSCSTHSVTNC